MNNDIRLIQLEGGDMVTRTEMVDRLFEKFIKTPDVLDTLSSIDKYKGLDKWDYRHRVGVGLDIKTNTDNLRGRIHVLKPTDVIEVVFKPNDYSDNGIVINVPVGEAPVTIQEKELVYTL